MNALPPGGGIEPPAGMKQTGGSKHTGPKGTTASGCRERALLSLAFRSGVINDFNIAKANLKNIRLMERVRREQQLQRAATGARVVSAVRPLALACAVSSPC